jgi:hypothetical protein
MSRSKASPPDRSSKSREIRGRRRLRRGWEAEIGYPLGGAAERPETSLLRKRSRAGQTLRQLPLQAIDIPPGAPFLVEGFLQPRETGLELAGSHRLEYEVVHLSCRAFLAYSKSS